MVEEKKVNLIKDHIIERVSPYIIYVFGSAAKGKMVEDSDIDVAFLSDRRFGDYEVFMIGQKLASLLDREVDLVDLSKASTVFQVQVVSTGKVIYCNDERRRMFFEMTVLKKYAMLNEERQCILEKVRERGTI
jgi:predicted nucleotidyltransferase